jgi:hypothetical protein
LRPVFGIAVEHFVQPLLIDLGIARLWASRAAGADDLHANRISVLVH